MLNYEKEGIKPNDGAYIHLLNGAVGALTLTTDLVDSISCALDLGARDCYDSIKLADFFGCEIHAFEANPDAVEFCKEHIKGRSDIFLNNFAVGDVNSEIDFYMVNTDEYPNIGASSIYEFDLNQQIQPPEVMRAGDKIQTRTVVQMKRLDDHCKSNNIIPDAIFMDIQGAELKALVGMGTLIDNVKIVALETQYHSCYKNAPVFHDLDSFLKSKGFEVAYCWQTHSPHLPVVPSPPKEFWFDLLYIRK